MSGAIFHSAKDDLSWKYDVLRSAEGWGYCLGKSREMAQVTGPED